MSGNNKMKVTKTQRKKERKLYGRLMTTKSTSKLPFADATEKKIFQFL